jgi:hypothetical protein
MCSRWSKGKKSLIGNYSLLNCTEFCKILGNCSRLHLGVYELLNSTRTSILYSAVLFDRVLFCIKFATVLQPSHRGTWVSWKLTFDYCLGVCTVQICDHRQPSWCVDIWSNWSEQWNSSHAWGNYSFMHSMLKHLEQFRRHLRQFGGILLCTFAKLVSHYLVYQRTSSEATGFLPLCIDRREAVQATSERVEAQTNNNPVQLGRRGVCSGTFWLTNSHTFFCSHAQMNNRSC